MNLSDSPDSISNFSSHSLQFSQTFGFSFPLSITVSVGLVFSKLQSIFSRIVSADFSGNDGLENFITLMSSFSTAYEKELNKKNSFYFGISGGYKEYLNIEPRTEKNMYHEWFDYTKDYDKFIF